MKRKCQVCFTKKLNKHDICRECRTIHGSKKCVNCECLIAEHQHDLCSECFDPHIEEYVRRRVDQDRLTEQVTNVGVVVAFILILIASIVITGSTNNADFPSGARESDGDHVKGYRRSDGTWVKPHTRRKSSR